MQRQIIWAIPVVLGLLSTIIDGIWFHGRLGIDFLCWAFFLLFVLLLGTLKRGIPIDTKIVIPRRWLARIVWVLAVLVWLIRLGGLAW